MCAWGGRGGGAPWQVVEADAAGERASHGGGAGVCMAKVYHPI